MGASTPHFALQLRNRIRTLIAGLPRRPSRPDRGRARDPAARRDRARLRAPRARSRSTSTDCRATAGPTERIRRSAGSRSTVSAWPGSSVSWLSRTSPQSSDELIDCLRERAEQGACRFTLVMPATGADARERLADALEAHARRRTRQRRAARSAIPIPSSPSMDVWDPMKFDEVIVSTLPTGSSRWLGLDLPHRLEKLTSVPVRHVVSTAAARARCPRARRRSGLSAWAACSPRSAP